ncbi:FliH/SctL family protein [Neisseriaceae bacterium TC5R-5]|nr:FliH/SctL family protein [Neisseriaceae bacterium TC5R-5]
MKVLSNKTIISADELGEWRSWRPAVLDGFNEKLTPVQLMTLSRQRRDELEASKSPAPSQQELDDSKQQTLSVEENHEVSTYPTAAELESIHQEAWQAGYDAGSESGRTEGYDQGLLAGREQGLAEVRAEQEARFSEAWQPLQQMAAQFANELSRVEHELSQDLLNLALALASRLVQMQIQTDSSVIAALLGSALNDLPATLGQARLRVNPADVAVAREFLSQETPETQWQWIEDPAIERGGCLIDTAALRLDLTLSSRLATLQQALGCSSNESEST